MKENITKIIKAICFVIAIPFVLAYVAVKVCVLESKGINFLGHDMERRG